MELSKRIKELRTEKGWSQEKLAELAFVSRQTVSNWETEKSYPDVHSLLILSNLFGVSLDELIKGDDEIMKDTIKNEDAGRLKKVQWLLVTEVLVLMFGCTLLVDFGNEIVTMLGCLLAGILSVCIFMTAREMEQIKQKNDIQTYREVLAFLNGETLDDIEKEKEQEKRRKRRVFEIVVAVVSGGSLIVAVVAAVVLFLFL